MPNTRVYLELGKTWVFASALDWPGWCRRGKGEDAALEALVAYADRYARVVGGDFAAGRLEVVSRVPGSATTDFGAPGAPAPDDDQPLPAAESKRLGQLLQHCWTAFDEATHKASEQLRKGPRGGGRDKAAMVEHVMESERSYARTIGVKLPPGTPWTEQRAAVLGALGTRGATGAWPPRYAVRRLAWHVLDHAWELEDKSL
ncbi:MAG: hypothetical protein JF888_03735 [Candidatus Dormibacteraeota bacterium]|uniref:Uncharacterized protein n=1 Tax=Candidatus Dormiibacter inghamiae TaxID=3127013 RepID=A0A934KBC7_9BACT|nr:hypothetical protein [Candidatus Dormibacteraeota bacterium]MBJ7604902.1 hypothetical protein [Candidatus Dormibacteraeota bacterium]